jgi:predicted bacteriocin transport accessory protein
MKQKRISILLAAIMASSVYGCSAKTNDGQKDAVSKQSTKLETSDTEKNLETEETENSSEDLPQTEAKTAEYKRDASAGSRTVISLEEAVQKKNAGEQFVLLYTKEDCSYCKEFDTVLNPYLENHHIEVFEVDLTDAAKTYSQTDLEAMKMLLSAGVARTPALYYIKSQNEVSLLDHTAYNYSADGLDLWVQKYQLDKTE